MLRNPACLEPKPENLFFPPKKGDYVYFEAPRPVPGGSFLVDAAWAADASMLAYARYGAVRMQEDDFNAIVLGAGFTSVQTFGDCFVGGACTARGFFATNDERGLLAFRGTEKDNVYDVAADGDLLLIDDAGTRVHQGFHRYLRTVWWQVSRLVAAYRKDHPEQDICVTGHSLGAALATLAFAYLGDPHTSLYTFGCPRVGNKAFCDRITAAAGKQRCYRIVDNEDLVTHIPLLAAGLEYEHPAITLLWLDANGKLVTNSPDHPSDWLDLAHTALGFVNGHLLEFLPVNLPRPLADHSPVRYCHWIAQSGEQQEKSQTV